MPPARKDSTVSKRFEAVAAALLAEAEVARGQPKGFGAGSLTVNGKIFAMITSKDRFVVKLPGPRVAALVAAGRGEPFDPGHGRRMKEWFETRPGSRLDWKALAREALAFVGAQPAGK